jgi:hypothetical protein
VSVLEVDEVELELELEVEVGHDPADAAAVEREPARRKSEAALPVKPIFWV